MDPLYLQSQVVLSKYDYENTKKTIKAQTTFKVLFWFLNDNDDDDGKNVWSSTLYSSSAWKQWEYQAQPHTSTLLSLQH